MLFLLPFARIIPLFIGLERLYRSEGGGLTKGSFVRKLSLPAFSTPVNVTDENRERTYVPQPTSEATERGPLSRLPLSEGGGGDVIAILVISYVKIRGQPLSGIH
ncbi:hypothetical protein EVAR_5716_1 [Eumeta japonica]|uniref:Uncharacterized protein n=1 Tax=Eumeta variegata TaxID=151549 RepID=A0A4C1TA09_EUMVA|nr:hypothetical protein EVAR_5716_1 [Eumeta japonica]